MLTVNSDLPLHIGNVLRDEPIAWPIATPLWTDVVRKFMMETIAFASEQNPVEKQVFSASTPLFIGRCRFLIVSALELSYQKESGIELKSIVPEIKYLKDSSLHSSPDFEAPKSVTVPGENSSPGFWRAMARTASWSTPLTYAKAYLAPAIFCISHNPLLVECAKADGRGKRFVHASNILSSARRNMHSISAQLDLDEMARKFSAVAVKTFSSCIRDEQLMSKLSRLIYETVLSGLSQSAADVGVMMKVRIPTQKIWSGTGGNYAARLIGLEVLRRGGEAVRFCHAGGSGLVNTGESLVITEFMSSSTLVAATKKHATLVNATREKFKQYTLPISTIESGQGYPSYRKMTNLRGVDARRNRVLYATSFARGARSTYPLFLSDVVYLDWQRRLLEAFGRLKTEFVFRPHPEGLLWRRKHPLSHLCEPAPESFETLLDDSDTLVFDFPNSTIFWKALCTDRKIILLDFSNGVFSTNVEEEIYRRVIRIKVDFDDRNVPIVDDEKIGAALADRTFTPDPTYFRSVFLGDVS